jgi:hypothetical protein
MKPRWSAKFAESRWDSRVLFEIADFGFVIKKNQRHPRNPRSKSTATESVPSVKSVVGARFIVQGLHPPGSEN